MPETNILHIIDTLGVGGAEKVMVGCVNGLPELKHHVIYLGGSDAMKKFLPIPARSLPLIYVPSST